VTYTSLGLADEDTLDNPLFELRPASVSATPNDFLIDTFVDIEVYSLVLPAVCRAAHKKTISTAFRAGSFQVGTLSGWNEQNSAAAHLTVARAHP
jgi:hypothetical protein